MKPAAKSFLLFLTAAAFFSCEKNTVSQPQNAQIAVPADTAQTQPADTPENTQTVVEDRKLSFLTLIPSVEPEQLRNVMPNSWRKLERLTEDEEQEFIRENIASLLYIEGNKEGTYFSSYEINTYFSIYKEQAGADTFYRVIATLTPDYDFLAPSEYFYIVLFHHGQLLLSEAFGYRSGNDLDGGVIYFGSIDIIPGAEGAKGVLGTSLIVKNIDWFSSSDWRSTALKRNGQLYGSSECYYYLMDDLINGNNSPFEITASNCLVDAAIPLRYSLQNVFDGNPATSFVQNEDGLLSIDFASSNTENITKIAIINGNAENLMHYRNYNRIESINLVSLVLNEERNAWIANYSEVELKDNTLGFQVFDVDSPSRMRVLSLINGETANVTHLSGLNFYHNDIGWLFGGIDE